MIGAGESPVADAGFGVVRDAQSLAFRALAARRRRPVGVHALADGHAHATLARGASHGGHRPAVPGAFQVVPDPRRRSFMDGAAVCGAKSVAGEPGRRGGCVAMVESLASRARQQGWTLGRRAAGAAATLAATRADAADRSGVGGVAAVGGARFSVWRGVVAGANGEATGPAIHVTSSRSAVAKTTKIKTPDPFTVDRQTPLRCGLRLDRLVERYLPVDELPFRKPFRQGALGIGDGKEEDRDHKTQQEQRQWGRSTSRPLACRFRLLSARTRRNTMAKQLPVKDSRNGSGIAIVAVRIRNFRCFRAVTVLIQA